MDLNPYLYLGYLVDHGLKVIVNQALAVVPDLSSEKGSIKIPLSFLR
tara:strand:- start:175 stop:315 length:141 start_codon:yes stop_codon:yes gene_type:complete